MPVNRSWADPREATLARILLAPAFVLLALVVVFPVGRLIVTSFQELALTADTPAHFIGWDNYTAIWDDPVFWTALGNTALITVVTVPGALVVGMVLALVANMPFRIRWPVRLALLVPWALPLAFVGLIFGWFFQSQYGIVNDLLRPVVNTPIIWFNSGALSMAAICLTVIWKTSSFVALILLAGLQTIAPDYYDGSAIVRRLEAKGGDVEVEVTLRLMFGYGELPPWWQTEDDVFVGEIGPDRVVLRGPGLAQDGSVIRGTISLGAGERADYVLQHGNWSAGSPKSIDPAVAQSETELWWRDWIGHFNKPTDWPAAVKRSLLTLRALTYLPTGGIVAAPTLGLPEKPGAEMNWDYRYCWLRDSTFTLTALLNSGFHEEALAWEQWLYRSIAGSPEKMRIMYRVDGGRQIEERDIEHLPGWGDAKPVRVGNAAAGQRQLDVFGEVIDSARLCQRAGIEGTTKGQATASALIRHVEKIWQEPDQGMWESRAAPQHYVYSKVMAWVAADRFLGLSDERRSEVEKLRDAIHADVCKHGYDKGRGSFMQSYGSRHLDASVLMLPLVGFLPVEDERIDNTIAAIEKGLMEGGFVRRQSAPWLGKEEGVFLPCTCWLADCLNMQGRKDEARALLEQVLSISNDLGLLSEEYHVLSKRLLGNFPQALTHIGVINTALSLRGPTLQRGGG